MALNPESKFSLSIKEIIGAVIGLSSLFGIYFTMQSSIASAQESIENLETNAVQKVEFSFKDEMIRSNLEQTQLQINNIEENVEEIKETVKKLDERIYELTK
jgi:septal ring factor EnvC (AmiA/AmiB activator)